MEWHQRFWKVLVASLVVIATTTNLIHAQRTDPCNPSPCLNGAECFTITDTVFFCYCGGTGNFGPRCEESIVGLQCPSNEQIEHCSSNPCLSDTCRLYPNAVCGHNLCGGCSSEFTVNGIVVDCDGGCPPDRPQVECLVDPCERATCSGRTDATCRSNYCGQCSAEFFDSADNQVDCSCPASNPTAVECATNACDRTFCPTNPNAECSSSSCGGCKVAFFENGLEVAECRQATCPVGVSTFNCFVDPCFSETCASDPSARCVPNFCGGCIAEFYNSAGERVDCASCPMERVMQCVLDPCAMTSCPEFPDARCQVNNCGMCSAVYYDGDNQLVNCGLDFDCVDDGNWYITGDSFVNRECRQCFCIMGTVVCSQEEVPDCVVETLTEAPLPQDPCDFSPCLNDGTCRSVGALVFCRCPFGYAGQRCEFRTNQDPCESFPCVNGGACFRSADSDSYTCDCPPGYIGDNCERANLCAPAPCLNGGSCSLTPNFIPVCLCAFGYTGSFCEAPVDFCEMGEILCGNGGTCQSHETYALCICPPGYTGVSCEEIVDPCLPNPCENQGFCLNRPGVPNNYICLCVMGYTGQFCETTRSVCDNFPCRNGGSCEEITTSDNMRSFTCQCPIGFTGSTCELIDEDPCSRVPCVNGFCFQITPTRGICICSSGYLGDACDTPVNPCISFTCQNGGQCVSEGARARCECRPGYAGSNCQILISPCAANPCFNQGSCVPDMSSLRGYTCNCLDRFEGDNCQTIVTNPCFPDPCVNGFCVISNVDTTRALCLCDVGYTGPNCEQSLAPCQSNPCLNGARCLPFSSGEGFFCNCTESFMGGRCEQQVLCNPNPCFNGGSCVREGLSEFSCRCRDGYVGDRCQILLDPCLNNNCINGDCQPFLRGYICLCYDGYTGIACDEQDGCPLTCPDDITLPAVANQQFYQVTWDLPETVCGYETSATSPPGNYFPRGQTFVQVSFLEDDGTAADQCTFAITIGDGSETPACDSSPCQNGGTCINLQGNMFICLCPATHRGENCQELIPTDPCGSSPCLNDGICLNIPQTELGYLCICRPEYIGARCGVPNDACASEPCQNRATCVSQSSDNTYICLCEAGYTGVNCDSALACFAEPCENGGQCIELGDDDYFCTCPPGYTGQTCEEVDRCDPSPCQNGGQCINGEPSYECRCPQGYSGNMCEIDESECVLECPGDIMRTVSPTATFAPVSWEYEPTVCGIPVMFTYMPGSSFPLGPTVVSGVVQNADILRQCDFTVRIVRRDPCLSAPCENNGRCVGISDIFVCQCPMGYMGLRCETPTTPEVSEACQSEPCQNGASCFGNEEAYFCQCTEGYQGPQCTESIPRDPCEDQPCQNLGTCIGLNDGFICLCLEGFGGETCEEISMVDVTPPRLDSCPRLVSEIAPLQNGGAPVSWSEPRATDDSGFTSVASQTRQSGSFFPFGNTSVVYNIQDSSGNSVFCFFLVTVSVEMRNPQCMPECPADIDVVTDGSQGFARVYWSILSLTCDYSVLLSHQSGNFFEIGRQEVSVEFIEGREVVYDCSFAVTVTRGIRNFCNLDPCQHLGTCQDLIDRYECICARGFTGTNCEVVTSVDEVRPVVSFCPADISTRTLIGAPNAAATWRGARAVDNSGTVIVSYQSHAPGDYFEVGVTMVVYEFCDPTGNKAMCQFRVIVESAGECRVRCPEDIYKFAEDGVAFIDVTWEQPETMCDYPVTSSRAPGSFFPHGNSPVTVMTVDESGNVIDQCTFTVFIQRATFGNPCNNPTICGTGGCILDPTMSEGFRCNCTRCYSGEYCERALPVANPCTSNIENLCQNGGTCNFIECDFSCTCPEEYTGEYCQIERVFFDMVPPTLIGCPVDIARTVSEEKDSAVVTWDRVRFVDDSGTAFFVGGNFASGDVFPLGLTTVRLIYSDASLNLEYCIFNVVVQQVNVMCDTNVCPDDIIQFNIGNLEYMQVFWGQLDTVCGHSVVSVPETGDLFPIGTTPVAWTMYDSEGVPQSGCTFSIMVLNDFTNPCFQEPCLPVEQSCVPSLSRPQGYICVCDGGGFDCSFQGSEDIEPPIITKCNNRSIYVEKGITTHSFLWTTPEATDNSGSALTPSSSHSRPYTFPLGSTEITYNFTDAAMNVATCRFNVTILDQDTQPPTISNCITPVIVPNAPKNGYMMVDYIEPSAEDISGISETKTTPSNHRSGGLFLVRESPYPIAWTFTDSEGNNATCFISIVL